MTCLFGIVLLVPCGCATVSRPAAIKQESARFGSDAAAAPAERPGKNAISSDETASVVPEQMTPRIEGEQDGAAAAKANDLERTGKSAPGDGEAFRKQLQEQIKSELTASVTEEISSLGEQVRSEVRNDMMREIWTMKQELNGFAVEAESTVHNDMLREIWTMQQAMAVPEWTRRYRFSGDFRLRYESDLFDKNNADLAQPANPTQIMNTRVDAQRYKYRVRFGAEAKVNEQVDAVMRLSTGNTSNPLSTNQAMGDTMNKDVVLFDLAYLKLQQGKSLTFYGGRMPNPWFSSDLVWARDLNFEGLALNARTSDTEKWMSFLTLGAFPLQQYDFSQHGKALMAGQAGLERKNQKGVAFKLGLAYYNFKNITGILNDPLHPGETDWTAPQYQQKGNTLFNISADPTVYKTALASEYKEGNLTGTLDIGFWDPVHIVFLGDYVKNLGFKKSDVAERTGNPEPDKQIEGYQLGMALGYPTIQESGQWRVSFSKKRLQADAVVDAFTDSDFHLGGTNATGWILGTEVGLSRNFWLTLKWLTANEISGPPLAIDVFQADLNARF